MPRRRRPGPRSNRTDLPPVTAATQAPVTFTGRPQGERQSTVQAQQVAPLPDRSVETLTAAAGQGAPADTGAGTTPPGDASLFQQFLAAAQQAQPPGDATLAAPSQRPGEPVTVGLSDGPGPGPEALPLMAAAGPDPSVVLWRQFLPALDLMASRPGSSPELRQFYRRVRSSLPPGQFEREET